MYIRGCYVAKMVEASSNFALQKDYVQDRIENKLRDSRKDEWDEGNYSQNGKTLIMKGGQGGEMIGNNVE